MEDSTNIKTEWTQKFVLSDTFVDFINLIPEAVLLSNTDGNVVLSNIVAQKLFGYSESEFQKLLIEDLVPENIHDYHSDLRAWFFKNPNPRILGSRYYDLCAVGKNKKQFPIESALFAIETDTGPLAVNILRDVTEKKIIENKVREYAYIDSLTQLPNRRYFDENLSQKGAMAVRNKQKLGLCFIDLDYFKEVNDQYGHEIGDKVLQEISNRLKSTLRKDDFLARIGGDEFVIIVYPCSSTKAIEELAKRLITVCHKPIVLDKCICKLSCSVGISLSKKGDVDLKKLFYDADHSMYQAKKAGRDNYHICKI